MTLFSTAKPHALQVALYILTGLTAAIVEFGSYLLLLHVGVWYVAASFVSYCLSVVVAFSSHKYVVFRIHENILKHLSRYFLIELFNVVFATLIIYLAVDVGGVDVRLAKLISMGSIVCWNFFFYKFFVYT